jgi:imidazole glycerol-phosphate synthase subunit HisF
MMRRIRIIPVLLLENGRLVKTVRFKRPTYVGDPINTVKIFNDKEADELCILDISADRADRAPDFELLKSIASEAFMPVSYGGGLNSIDHVKQLFRMGVEKAIFNTAAFYDPELITESCRKFGSSSVVVSVDVKKDMFGRERVFVSNGKKNTGIDPITFSKMMEEYGVGELILHSIEKDGTYSGYDIKLVGSVTKSVSIPVIALGGASQISDFVSAVHEGNASAVAAGSFFIYQRPHQAVLITYPDEQLLMNDFYKPLQLAS